MNALTKHKKKRSRSSSSDKNDSFVKNVTSKMAGLLPATITKWFSSPTTSSDNGAALAGDTTDSSTEEEPCDNERDPPTKRMRFSTNISPVPPHVQSEGGNRELFNYFNMVHSTPGPNAQKRDSIFVSTSSKTSPDGADINTNTSDIGLDLTAPSALTFTNPGPSLEIKRKSLFDSVIINRNTHKPEATFSKSTQLPNEEPAFKATLLGSPFYKGRTMYGGSGASYYLNEPNVKQRSLAIVNETKKSDDMMSGAARRVMDILESYSSPLSEAKRIPTYIRSPSKNHSFESTSSRPSIHQLQSIQVPSVGTFLNIKQRSRLMDSTSAARQIMASQSSSSDFIPYLPSQARTKMDSSSSSKSASSLKSRLKSAGRQSDREQVLAPALELPSAVLNIDQGNLPKFSFGQGKSSVPATPALKQSVQPDLPVSTSINSVSKVTDNEQMITDNNFRFSSPIRIAQDDTPIITTPPNITVNFNKADRSPSFGKLDDCSTLKATEAKHIVSKEWRCNDCWVNNKDSSDKCVCCGGSKPSINPDKKDKKCSLCKTLECEINSDKCAPCKSVESIPTNKITTAKSAVESWKCPTCMVNNKLTDENCVCCGEKRAEGNARATVDLKATGLTAMKPYSDNASENVSNNKIKPLVSTNQSNQWECPSCLVRNDSSKLKCVCCETEKPGTVKGTEKKVFSFGIPNSNFKFGIVPQTTDENAKPKESSTIKNILDSKETEKNNNSLNSTPKFSFGVPPNKAPDLEAKKDKDNVFISNTKDEPSKDAGFVFAKSTESVSIKPNPDSKTLTISDTIQKDTVFTKDLEKEQEVPKMNTLEEKSKLTVAPSIYFGTLSNKQTTENTSVVQTPSINKDSSSAISAVAPALTPTKPLFTFPSKQTEQNNEQIANAPVITSSPSMIAPVTSAANMFSAEPKSNPPATMFQNVEPIVTQAATPTLFSFGQTAKPPPTINDTSAKFNFSFGANKSETSTPFVPAFGINSDATKTNPLGLQPAASINKVTNESSSATPAANIFGSPAAAATQNENMWPPPAMNNNATAPNAMFGSTTSINLNKPPSFNFGASSNTPFKLGNSLPPAIFSSNSPNTAAPAFGTTNAVVPTFGSSLKPASNAPQSFTPSQPGLNASPFGNNTNTANPFGIQAQNSTNQPSIFSNQEANSPFSGKTPGAGLFGAPSAGSGTPHLLQSAPSNIPPPSFDAPSPAFNFAASPAPAPGLFSFNQPQAQPNVYSFGATQNNAPHVQFNMGSPGAIAPSPSTAVRKVRKAVRRTPR